MCLFVESIKLEDGKFKRLEFHQARINCALKAIYPQKEIFSLADCLAAESFPHKGVFKCRVVYDTVVRKIEFVPYFMREIKSLLVIQTEIESLAYKLENRAVYNNAFNKRMNYDDVLLVKDGLITDTSYCNVAVFDGDKWYTPRLPLLYGVNRAQLISTGTIIEKDIKVDELLNYQSICLFNALIEFGTIVIDISAIGQ